MAVNGSIWIEGTSIHFLDDAGNHWVRYCGGGEVASGAVPGSIWIEGNKFCIIGADGKKYWNNSTDMGAAAGAVNGSLWIDPNATRSPWQLQVRYNRKLQFAYGGRKYAVHADAKDHDGSVHYNDTSGGREHYDEPYNDVWSNTAHSDSKSHSDIPAVPHDNHIDSTPNHIDYIWEFNWHEGHDNTYVESDPHADNRTHSDNGGTWPHVDNAPVSHTNHTNHSAPGHSNVDAHNNHTHDDDHDNYSHTDYPRLA